MVVPEGIIAPLGFIGGHIDPDIVSSGAHNHLLTPVTEQITLIARGALCVVVGHRACQGGNQTFAVFVDTTCRILSISVIKRFIAEITIPIDTHIVGTARLRQSGYMLIGDTTDGIVMSRESHRPRIIITEIGCHTPSVIITTSHSVTDFRCRSITVIVRRPIFIAGKYLLSPGIRIKIAMMLSITMTETGS